MSTTSNENEGELKSAMQVMMERLERRKVQKGDMSTWHYYRVFLGLVKETHEDSKSEERYSKEHCEFFAALNVEFKKVLATIGSRPRINEGEVQ
jgi:hypothetical protein